MNKNEIKKLFWKVVNEIEECCDVITKNEQGVVIERGMALTEDITFSYVLDKGTIALYIGSNELILEFDENSIILLAFKELIECVFSANTNEIPLMIDGEEIARTFQKAAQEVPVQEQLTRSNL